jgi:PAS domain S-box-containing protein
LDYGLPRADRYQCECDPEARCFARHADTLEASEAKFGVLTDPMPQMVWSTTPDGYRDYYNARWHEFTGVLAGSTDGEEWNRMFHEEDREEAWARWRHSLATGEPYEIEYRLRHHSGEYRWTLGKALPVRNQRGEVIRWIGTRVPISTTRSELPIRAN